MDYVALKAEIDNDPNGYGYKTGGEYRDDMATAAMLNDPRAGIAIPRGRVPMYELIGCIDKAEYAALSQSDKDIVQMIAKLESVDTSNMALFGLVATIFPGIPTEENPAVTNTGQALVATIYRQGSRAEQLFGAGTIIDHLQVAKALRA